MRTCEDRPGFKEYVQAEFRKNAKIPRSNILRIEHLIRKGEKQLKDLKQKDVQSISVMKLKTNK